MNEAESAIRWDWVVVLTGFMLLSIVALFGWFGRSVAFAGAYGLGRWDSDFGVKYRQRAGDSRD